jgi:ATP-dependent DNA helicase RecG
MEGTQQSGIAFSLHIANIATDGQILQLARDTAAEIIDSDPDLSLPSHRILSEHLKFLFKRQVNWSLIS